MFEGFLDQGIKQSEGQYFTPMPICRFLLMSLPVETLVRDKPQIPRAIDYACGAGHFLTELALQLKPLVEKHQPTRDIAHYHEQIVGIEKEYRLSKIAKVSAFMYQQPGIRICHADALIHDHEAYPEVENGTFDLLVANPPFSVRGFLETLPESERARYTLTDTIKNLDTANSIETFFIERASQLLKPGGIAAIILPASILSKGGTYTRAREILLQTFDIAAIAEFGSGTFGKTTTNTVTLFLRRKAEQPSPADHYRGRITEWFKGIHNNKRKQVAYKDVHRIDAYASRQEIDPADYKTLLCGEPNDALLAHDLFVAYRKDFDNLTTTKSLLKGAKFKAKPQAEREAELKKRFISYLHDIEQDKLLHHILASEQPHPVLVVKSPSATKERKAYLGYDWSSAKGDEGIKLIKDASGHHLTPLYDETDRDNVTKINHAIARNFLGELEEIPQEIGEYVKLYNLTDLLDFMRTGFDKQISLTAKATITIQSKWPLIKLGCLAEYSADRVDANTLDADTYVGVDNLLQQLGGKTKSDFVPDTGRVTRYKKGDILLSNIRPYLKKIWMADNDGGASNDVLVMRKTSKEFESGFIYTVLSQDTFFEYVMVAAKGAKMPRGDKQHILNYCIPQPQREIQKKIVKECGAVDRASDFARSVIDKSRTEIEKQIQRIYESSASRASIDSLSTAIQYGLSKAMNENGVGYKIFRMNEITHGRMVDNGAMKFIDISEEEFKAHRLNRGNVLFNRTNGSFDQVGKSGIFDYEGDYCCASYLVRIEPDREKIVPTFLVKMMNSPEFLAEIRTKAVRSAGQNNINATKMRNMEIPVPPLGEQKRFEKKIKALDNKIALAEGILNEAEEKKAEILKSHL